MLFQLGVVETGRGPGLICEFFEFFLVDRKNSNQTSSLAVSVDKEIFDMRRGLLIAGFELFGRYVFSVLKFEKIFLSVDDFKGISMRREDGDISAAKPSIRGESFSVLLVVVIVTGRDSRASDPELASGSGVAEFIAIGGKVAEIWGIDELVFESLRGSADMPGL